MATDHIRYDVLTRDALRGVLRHVLTDAAENGLPGEHHFYITFLTKADGVDISARLQAQYPEEMTIILQHQFWDLKVGEQEFEVGLSFGGIPEKLVIPFSAINGFFDPSVKFGLQFETADGPAAESSTPTAPAMAAPKSAALAEVSAAVTAQDKAAYATAETKEAGKDTATDKSDADKPSEGGAEVVRLDRFRKK